MAAGPLAPALELGLGGCGLYGGAPRGPDRMPMGKGGTGWCARWLMPGSAASSRLAGRGRGVPLTAPFGRALLGSWLLLAAGTDTALMGMWWWWLLAVWAGAPVAWAALCGRPAPGCPGR